MGRKATIRFRYVPLSTDSFGIDILSGSNHLYQSNSILWDNISLTPGFTTEMATNSLFTYLTSVLVNTDVKVILSSDTINLFSDSATIINFYSGGNINNTNLSNYGLVSTQNWISDYSVSSNVINLTWEGASDPEDSIDGYELFYKLSNSNTWIYLPFIKTSDSGTSYDFVINQQITHNFKVRTVDTSGLKSEFKYYDHVISPLFKISSISNSSDSCTLASPDKIVYVNNSNNTISKNDKVYTNSALTDVFDGTRNSITTLSSNTIARNWKMVTPTNVFYNCRIDANGEILDIPTQCILTYNSGLISNKTNVAKDACGYSIRSANKIYWDSTKQLIIGTKIFTNVEMTTAVLSGFYHVYYQDPVSQSEEEYIIRLDNTGSITFRSVFSTFCAYKPTSNNSSGSNSSNNSSSEVGCVDPLVLILLPNGTKLAGQIEVGDIILTIHDITRELGEFKVLSKKIVTQPKVVIKFTDGTEIKVSNTHKFLMYDNNWDQVFNLKVNDTIKGINIDKTILEILEIGDGDVVKLEIEDAHTYISDGLISHNTKIYQGI